MLHIVKGEKPMSILRKLFVGFCFTTTIACLFNTDAIGGSSARKSFADPTTGLDTLTHFRAALTIAIEMQSSGGQGKQTNHYELAGWPKENAFFESIDEFDSANQELKMILGKVGDAGYLQWTGETGCQTFWNESNVRVDATSLAPLMESVQSGASAGDETINGVATTAYQLNSDSIGIEGVQATGKAWIATDGGYLVKSHLELTGGQGLFGSEETGTKTIDYELTEINNGAPISYPGHCRPVLADIPAADNAQNIERYPEILLYRSSSTREQLQAFYDAYFTGQGWSKLDEHELPTGEKVLTFNQQSTGREAIVTLEPQTGNITSVEVQAYSSGSGQTPSADSETPDSVSQSPLARISAALSKLLGSPETPSPFPSFELNMEEKMPSASGINLTTLQAQIQGANIHFLLNNKSGKTDAYLFNGKEYAVANGKAQPGSPTIRSDWVLWRTDPILILSKAAMAAPTAQPGVTFENRSVDVFLIDSSKLDSPLEGSGMDILPFEITTIQGSIWIDHDTGALLKADLQFNASVRKPGTTGAGTQGIGELHITASQIGMISVVLPQ
jgi:hypothetical protein